MFKQAFRFTVSANYQAYDFEINPRSTRSTVFRRVSFADSISLRLHESVDVLAEGSYQVEELGRLYWDEFEEARSDETHSWGIAGQVRRHFARTLLIGVGYMWDRRLGDQFLDGNTRKRFQDLNSYGPILSLQHSPGSGFFLAGAGRALQQFELNQDARWIVSGQLTGGYRW